MNNSNPLYSIFPQYSHHELDQIYGEHSYDADAASEQITNGALDWNKNEAQRLKKKTFKLQQKRWVKPRKESRESNKSGSSPIVSPVQPLPTPKSPVKMEKQDSAMDKGPTMSFVLQHGKDKVEMVEADLSSLDLSKYVVLIPKSVYEKNEKEIFDRQFTSILHVSKPKLEHVETGLPSLPLPAKSVAATQTFRPSTTSTQTFQQSANSPRMPTSVKPLFNSVPVHDKLRLLGIEDNTNLPSPRPNNDLKDFVLNMGIGLNEPTSPTTPPNTPVSAKPKYKKQPYKKRYAHSTGTMESTTD